jgi:hypothetical protein
MGCPAAGCGTSTVKGRWNPGGRPFLAFMHTGAEAICLRLHSLLNMQD